MMLFPLAQMKEHRYNMTMHSKTAFRQQRSQRS
jgi:hypothetical protein